MHHADFVPGLIASSADPQLHVGLAHRTDDAEITFPAGPSPLGELVPSLHQLVPSAQVEQWMEALRSKGHGQVRVPPALGQLHRLAARRQAALGSFGHPQELAQDGLEPRGVSPQPLGGRHVERRSKVVDAGGVPHVPPGHPLHGERARGLVGDPEPLHEAHRSLRPLQRLGVQAEDYLVVRLLGIGSDQLGSRILALQDHDGLVQRLAALGRLPAMPVQVGQLHHRRPRG